MKVTALAGGVGGGKFLRGLARVVDARELTAVVNTADDMELYGLHVSPDLDSVTYWLSGLADRERGWGRAGETFRALDEVRRLGGQAWFSLGDQDLATHLVRTQWLAEGVTLSEATDRIRRALGVEVRVLPMSDQQVRTWMVAIGEGGERLDESFQEYWVERGGRDQVKEIRLEGIDRARPPPGLLRAIAGSDVLVICPSNPVVSIAPILAVPGIRDAVRARRERTVGVSPIVGGSPVLGMADRLMPVVGLEVSAAGAARAYEELLSGWVIDHRDADLRTAIERELRIAVGVTDTIMVDDDAAERLARFTLELVAA
jgi:LPPG:FO 2-phospho-L-lactate transferase